MKSFLPKNYLIRDIGIITISVLVSIILVRTGIIHGVITWARDWQYLGSFISGMFFTSVFTAAPATVALGEFAQSGSIWITALLGAAGAVIGDSIIFFFVRKELSGHIDNLVSSPKTPKRLVKLFHHRWFRWIPFFLGGLILASPLPDELGVGLMGISHANAKTFAVVSFIFNFIGILIIGLVVRAV